MAVSWKEVKTRKEYQCLCCGGSIPKGEKHLVRYEWKEESKFPQFSRFCYECGVWVKEGYSFRQARIKAFGSPYLRGWRYPK